MGIADDSRDSAEEVVERAYMFASGDCDCAGSEFNHYEAHRIDNNASFRGQRDVHSDRNGREPNRDGYFIPSTVTISSGPQPPSNLQVSVQ